MSLSMTTYFPLKYQREIVLITFSKLIERKNYFFRFDWKEKKKLKENFIFATLFFSHKNQTQSRENIAKQFKQQATIKEIIEIQ